MNATTQSRRDPGSACFQHARSGILPERPVGFQPTEAECAGREEVLGLEARIRSGRMPERAGWKPALPFGASPAPLMISKK